MTRWIGVAFRGFTPVFRLACLALFLLEGHAWATPPAGYYLVWNDEFNGPGLDSTFWNYRALGARRDAYNVTNAVSLNGSNLVITTYTLNGTNFTGMVATDSKFLFKYGYIEASVNFDDSPGEWSAFWLQSPAMGTYIGDPAASGTEIDICEHRRVDGSGNNIDGVVVANLHWDGYGTYHRSVGSGNIGSGLGNGFHTYGCKWTETNYAFLIDDVQRWATTSAVSARSEYILLSSEVEDVGWAGSIPTGGYGNLTTSTTRCFVDFVRYYAPTTTVFWDGSSSSAWTNGTNWVAGRSPKGGEDVVFSYLSTANPATALGQDFAIRSLSVLETPASISVTGGVLTVGAGGLDLISARNDASFHSKIVLGSAQTWNVGANRTLNANAEVAGSGNLTVDGYGAVRLAASNSLAGTVTVAGGTVKIGGSYALGSPTAGTIVRSNAQLMIGSGTYPVPIAEPLYLHGNTNGVYAAPLRVGESPPAVQWSGPITLLSDSAVQLDGSRSLVLTNTATITGTNNDLVLAGDGGSSGSVYSTISLGNGGLTKSGGGTWTLFASNAFAGDTRVSGGTLSLRHTNALVLSTLDMATNDTGLVTFNNLNGVLGGLKGGRDLVLGSGVISIGSNSQSTAYGGTLSGAARLVKVGSGSLSLTDSNAWSGGTLISQGVLQLGSNTPTGSLPGTITNNGVFAIYRSDSLTLANPVFGSGDFSVRTTNGLTIDGRAAVNLGGTMSVGRDYYGRLILMPGAQVSVGNLYLGNPANVSGDVVQLGGTMIVTNQFRIGHWPNETSSYVLGGGNLILAGKPTGLVNPSGVAEQPGILYLGIDGVASFTQTNGIASAEGIVLDGRSETAGTDALTINGGSFLLGASGIKSGSLDANTSFQINLGGGAFVAAADWASSRPMTFTAVGGSFLFDTVTNIVTLTGNLSGNGGFRVQGNGALVLAGSNSFSGDAVILGGTLNLAGICAGSNAVLVETSAAVKGAGTNVGPITVKGSISPGAGVGTLTTGPQTWSAGGIYLWEISNPTNSSGWDRVNLGGLLTVTATPAAPFVLKLVSLSAGGSPGPLQGFDHQMSYTWQIANGTGVAGFDPAAFAIDVSAFSNALGGGAFTVEVAGSAVVLKFHPNTGPPVFTYMWMDAGGAFQLSITGVPGKNYTLETTTNLTPPALWLPVTNGTANLNGGLHFTDSGALQRARSFYRILAP